MDRIGAADLPKEGCDQYRSVTAPWSLENHRSQKPVIKISFDQLSDELVVEIAKQHVNIFDGDNRYLRHLALCSRHPNNVVSPLLYRKFTQRWNKLASLSELLLLVMEKPTVGAEIKELVLRQFWDNKEELMGVSSYSIQDFQRCHTARDSFADFSIDKSEWIADVERGNWDAVVSLLLFFLPSLEAINVESGGRSSWRYVDQVIKHMAIKQRSEEPGHHLGQLKMFSNAYWDTENGMSLDSILPICALPSLTTVRAFQLEYDPSAPQAWRSPRRRECWGERGFRLGELLSSKSSSQTEHPVAINCHPHSASIRSLEISLIAASSTMDFYISSEGGHAPVWGPPTSTLNFCEEDYKYTPYVAEVFNTLTNLTYIGLGILGILNNRHLGVKSFGPQLPYLTLINLGLASSLFHSTLKYYMQMCDEFSMLIATFTVCHRLLSFYQQKISSRVLAIGLCVLIAFVATAQLLTGESTVQQVVFTLMAYWLWHTSFKIIRSEISDKGLGRRLRIMSLSGIGFFICGHLCWMADFYACQSLRAVRAKIGMPWAAVLELHGFWHILTGVGVYIFMVIVECLRCVSADGKAEADDLQLSATGVWPFMVYLEKRTGVGGEGKKGR